LTFVEFTLVSAACAVLVFFDKYDYTTLRSASVVFIDNVRAGTFPRTWSSRV
jgi:hypothetical protein